MLDRLLVKDKLFYKQLLLFALPIILQNVITIGINMMDTVMLGSFGEVQLSASSLANDFINIFQILCMGLGCGAAVLTAQYWGSKDIRSLKKAVALMLRVTLITATIFTVVTLLCGDTIMGIYGSDPEVIEKGVLYFNWSILTYLLMGISLTLTQILRSIRQVKIPMYATIISFFINIFFNWMFIFGKLGAPRMEIAGAALGTVIARVFETLWIGGYFFVVDQKVGFRFRDIFMPVGDIVDKYFKYCLPVVASDALLAFGNTAVSIIIGHLGTYYVAAYAIIAVIQRLSTVFTGGIGMAAHTMTGNRIGQGHTEQAYHEAITMLTLSVALGVFSGVLMNLLGPWIIGMYDIVSETQVIGMGMLRAISIMIVFQSMQSVITKGVLRGGGDTKFCLAIDAVFLWTVSVPLGYFTGLVLHLSPFIILMSLKADWAIKSIIGTKRILSGKWIKTVAE